METEEEEKDVVNQPPKDVTETSFTSTVNILSSSHYTLPIDYPDSPSDDDNNGEKPIHHSPSIEEPLPVSTSSLRGPGIPPVIQAHVSEELVSSVQEERHHSMSDVISSGPTSTTPTSDGSHEVTLNLKTSETCPAGPVCPQTSIMVSSEEMINTSVAYCDSTTVMTTVSTGTRYSQGSYSIATSSSYPKEATLSEGPQDEEHSDHTAPIDKELPEEDDFSMEDSNQVAGHNVTISEVGEERMEEEEDNNVIADIPIVSPPVNFNEATVVKSLDSTRVKECRDDMVGEKVMEIEGEINYKEVSPTETLEQEREAEKADMETNETDDTDGGTDTSVPMETKNEEENKLQSEFMIEERRNETLANVEGIQEEEDIRPTEDNSVPYNGDNTSIKEDNDHAVIETSNQEEKEREDKDDSEISIVPLGGKGEEEEKESAREEEVVQPEMIDQEKETVAGSTDDSSADVITQFEEKEEEAADITVHQERGMEDITSREEPPVIPYTDISVEQEENEGTISLEMSSKESESKQVNDATIITIKQTEVLIEEQNTIIGESESEAAGSNLKQQNVITSVKPREGSEIEEANPNNVQEGEIGERETNCPNEVMNDKQHQEDPVVTEETHTSLPIEPIISEDTAHSSSAEEEEYLQTEDKEPIKDKEPVIIRDSINHEDNVSQDEGNTAELEGTAITKEIDTINHAEQEKREAESETAGLGAIVVHKESAIERHVVEEEATSTQTPEPEEPYSVTVRTVRVSDKEPVTNTDTEGDILAVTAGKEDIAIDATQEANTDDCEEGKSNTPPRAEEVEVFTSKQAISLTVNELPDTSNAPVSPLPTGNDATDSSSDTETSSETESKLEPEPESQTLVPPVPVVLPSLSSSSPPPTNSLQATSSISSLFSTLPPFSSICASPISLSTSTQYTTAFSGGLAPSSIPSLTFGTISNYRSKHPQHVSVLTSRSSRSLPSILTPSLLSDLAPPSSRDSGSVQATCGSSTSSGIIELSDDAIIISGGTSLQTSPPSLPSPSSSSIPHTVLAQASTSVGPVVSTSTVSVPTVSVATSEGGSLGKGIKEEEEEWVGEGVDDVTAQQLKLAQQKLAMLKRHPFSPLYKPTDVSSLERVGSDSQNNMYWYDGGRNLYQSPPIWDPAAKPKESELVLVCKSFIQWQNKLKQLRSSCHEPDSKLAQIIKQMYLSRVKIATKRKTKDPVAVSSSSQHQRNSSPLTTPSVAQSMATAATAAIQQASNLTSLQVPQGLPQGSILVVPSSTVLQGGGGAAGFSGVPLLPVFANTAVILPQNIQTQQPSSQFAASSQMRAFESHHHNIGGVRDSEVSRDSPVTGRRSKAESKGQTEDEVIIQRVEAPKNVYHPFPAISMATNTAAPLPPTHSFFSPVQLPKEGEESGKKQSHPFFASSKSQVSGGVEILKVEAESEMGFIDKNTKSLEILEEVPIRKISIESSLTAHEGTLLCHSSSPSLPSSSSSCHINNGDPVTRGQANNVTAPTPCSQPSSVSMATGVPTTGTIPSSVYSHTMSESNAIVALTELATKARTTQEVMSAKTLLSLHGPGGQPLLPQLVSLTPPTSSPSVPPSTARPKKTPRKQKPVASARSVVPGNQGNPSLAPPPHSIVVTGNNNKNVSPSSATPTVSETKTKKKEYTPEELLKILDIPLKPSQSSFDDIKKPNSSDTQTSRVSPQKSFESSQKDTQSGGLGKGAESRKDAPPSFYRVTESRNEVLLSRQEGAESDSESTDSSSDNESSTDEEKERKGKKGQPVSIQRQTHAAALPSSRVVPHTTVSSSSSSSSSTSSSSSEDSSDEEVIQPKPSKGKKIGGVVGGGVKGKAPAAKRQKPSGRNKELLRSVSRAVKVQAQKPQKPSPAATKKQQKGVALKRLQKKKPLPVVKSQAPPKKSRAQRPPSRQKKPTSLIVSILKRFLETAKRTERKRKQETDSENESDDTLSSNSAGASPPPTKFTSRKQKEDTSSSTAPPDLKKYYNPDRVDLKTLRELTRSVVPERDGGSRSKRTCVRVREEIAKLQEMLDADGEKILVPAGAQGKNNKSQPGGGVSVGKGSVKGGKRTKGSQGSSSKKKKVSQKEVSQFRSVSNSTRIKYVFSTQLANQAAEAVWRSKFESVIAFHKAQQVKGSKFLRLPGKETLGGTRGTWETNGRVNLRPRASVSKSNKTAGQKRPGGRGGRPNHTELRRSKRLAKTKEDSEKEEEEKEDEEEEEEEDEEEEEEEEERPKLIRSAVRKKRSPLVPDDISTPSSDDVTSSASECNEEEEEEEKEEEHPLAKHSPSVSPQYHDEETHERERLSSHEATPQPRPSESSHVALSNQTPVQTPAGTPNQPPSKEDVNYTICHGTPEMRLPSASDVDHTPSSSQTYPQVSIGQHSSIVMATSGTVSTGHVTWSSGFPHSQLHNAYPQIYSKLHPSAPTAMYPHQPYPYQVTYPWPHPPEHPDHARQLSVAPAALPSNWPAPPTKDGGKTSSGSSLSRPHYYSSSGKHSSSASHHHLPPGHFPFPPQPPGGGGGVNPAYGFESHHSSLAAAAHVWPPHQMPHPQLHSLVPAAAPHPAAHLAPQGIPWSAYPRHLQAPVGGHHHLGMERITGSGSVVIDKGGKSKDRKGESKIINSNSNNNNNGRGFPLSWSPPDSSKR